MGKEGREKIGKEKERRRKWGGKRGGKQKERG